MRIHPMLLVGTLLQAQAPDLVLVTHPTNAVPSISNGQATDLVRGQLMYLGGKKVQIFLPKASSKSLQGLCFGLLKMSPLEYLQFVKSMKNQGFPLEVTFLDSVEQVEAAVKGNPSAVTILSKAEMTSTGLKITPIKG